MGKSSPFSIVEKFHNLNGFSEYRNRQDVGELFFNMVNKGIVNFAKEAIVEWKPNMLLVQMNLASIEIKIKRYSK